MSKSFKKLKSHLVFQVIQIFLTFRNGIKNYFKMKVMTVPLTFWTTFSKQFLGGDLLRPNTTVWLLLSPQDMFGWSAPEPSASQSPWGRPEPPTSRHCSPQYTCTRLRPFAPAGMQSEFRSFHQVSILWKFGRKLNDWFDNKQVICEYFIKKIEH